MTGFCCRTKVNRQSKARGSKPGNLNCDSFKDSITRKWFFAIICLIFVVSGSGIAVPQAVRAADEGYLLDRVITWADGTTEHVQIGKDAFFYLDGQKKPLVGMTVTGINPNSERFWEFWKPDSLALLDKQLSYFQSVGLRLARVRFIGVLNSVSGKAEEEAAYTAYLDVFYKHKILVIMLVDARLIPHFDGLAPVDFIMWQQDTVSQWATRLANISVKYANIVSICADNELDNKAGLGQKYTTEQAKQYLALLAGIFRSKDDAVITHTLMANEIEPGIKKVVLNQIDIPSLNAYFESPDNMKKELSSILPRIGVSGGWWCMELGAWTKDGCNSDKVNAAYIDAAFESGATVALLFLSIDWVRPDFSYFNNDGTPKPLLVAIGNAIPRLQSPIMVDAPGNQLVARK